MLGEMLTVSVGVCAYNEGRNIGRCLESILSQKVEGFCIHEILVISSGSTDNTDSVVKDYSVRDHRVRLIRQDKREGKNSAINLFLSEAKGDIMVLANADNRLAEGCLQALLEPFLEEKVGVVGGHPIPVNTRDTITGVATHMLWEMHHRISLMHPKVGELLAFRPLAKRLPTDTQSDEDLIRMELESLGLVTVYAPRAVVYNKGPTTVKDFLKQRTRVNIGERYMRRIHDYRIPTWDSKLLLNAFFSYMKDSRDSISKIMIAVILETWSRFYATLYVALDKGDKAVWQQVQTTKDLE
ncbi:MAG: glycosyltransferase [Methanomassiliicoccales archaeon]